MMIKRKIELPIKQSFFLLGPRQTGKSTLIHSRLGPRKAWTIDLLFNDLFIKYSKAPELFRLEAIDKIEKENIEQIFIDEIQRIPLLLNEVHVLIERFPKCQFIMTGSSARKIKKGAANLLAGRAVQRTLHPLLFKELGADHFKLEEHLVFGTLPVLEGKARAEKIDILTAYANTYLREEIQNEGLVRNLGGFSRFLDLAASQSGEILNVSTVAREAQIPIKTVQSYYEILEDTLIGFRLEVWHRSLRKRLTRHPKFYLFDLGVLNAINRRLTATPEPILRGKLFEHFIILETKRLLDYHRSEARLFYWRTHHGAEVDLLIEKHGKIIGAFEIKASKNISSAHLSGIRSFLEENTKVPCAVIACVENPYQLENVRILPWSAYLKELEELIA